MLLHRPGKVETNGAVMCDPMAVDKGKRSWEWGYLHPLLHYSDHPAVKVWQLLFVSQCQWQRHGHFWPSLYPTKSSEVIDTHRPFLRSRYDWEDRGVSATQRSQEHYLVRRGQHCQLLSESPLLNILVGCHERVARWCCCSDQPVGWSAQGLPDWDRMLSLVVCVVMCMAWLQAKSQAKPSHTGQAKPSQKCWLRVGFGLAWTSWKPKPMAQAMALSSIFWANNCSLYYSSSSSASVKIKIPLIPVTGCPLLDRSGLIWKSIAWY